MTRKGYFLAILVAFVLAGSVEAQNGSATRNVFGGHTFSDGSYTVPTPGGGSSYFDGKQIGNSPTFDNSRQAAQPTQPASSFWGWGAAPTNNRSMFEKSPETIRSENAQAAIVSGLLQEAANDAARQAEVRRQAAAVRQAEEIKQSADQADRARRYEAEQALYKQAFGAPTAPAKSGTGLITKLFAFVAFVAFAVFSLGVAYVLVATKFGISLRNAAAQKLLEAVKKSGLFSRT